jgi:hypothetical protein
MNFCLSKDRDLRYSAMGRNRFGPLEQTAQEEKMLNVAQFRLSGAVAIMILM